MSGHMACHKAKIPSTPTFAPKNSALHASWSTDDEAWLLQYLLDHKSKAGDGMSFKKPTFTAAAAHVNEIITKGGPKTSDSCKNKYCSLKMTYELVNAICNNSGWSWDDQGGVQVTPEKQRTWDAFVDKNPGAEVFADGC
ncbi:hypothetical protein H2248_008125 [Termitomyces sp. 'cryptogamus']|nr:hypothetical protein H2248_008125 [Termitomyces sp. 'cryptogamus']